MGSMHLYFPKGRMPAWRPPLMRLFLVYILHHVLHTALQQPAELIDGVGRYVAAVLHGVKVRQREAQLYCWTQTRALFILATCSPAMTLMGGSWSFPGTSCPASLPGPGRSVLLHKRLRQQRQRKERDGTPSRKSDAYRQAAPEAPQPGWPRGSPEQNSCCPKRKDSQTSTNPHTVSRVRVLQWKEGMYAVYIMQIIGLHN